jgi:hypothetical protein
MFASAVHMIGAGAVVMAVFWLTLLILGVSSAARALSERRDKAATSTPPATTLRRRPSRRASREPAVYNERKTGREGGSDEART